MNRIANRILGAILAIAVPAAAHAVCAIPGPVKVKQPDGSTVTVRIHGDENFNWLTSTDGYTLVHDAGGLLTYAAEKSGRLVPSGLRYVDGNSAEAAAVGLKPGMMPEKELLRHRSVSKDGFQTQIDATFPTKGKRKLLMVLVNYNNTKPVFSQQDFDGYMNGEAFGGIGSFRDYYLENSYGQLDITTTVTRLLLMLSVFSTVRSTSVISTMTATAW